MTNNLENLKNYFCTEHEKKIFCTKLCVKGKCFDILYDYDKKHEIDNFVSNFSEYLPYYVYNADTLECMDNCRALCVLLCAHGGDQRRNAGTDILAHDNRDSRRVADLPRYGQRLQNAHGS